MDYTTFLTEGLDWVQNLSKVDFVENVFGDEPDIFMCYARHSPDERYFNAEINTNFLVHPIIESNFIASKPNIKLFNESINEIVDTYIGNYGKFNFSGE